MSQHFKVTATFCSANQLRSRWMNPKACHELSSQKLDGNKSVTCIIRDGVNLLAFPKIWWGSSVRVLNQCTSTTDQIRQTFITVTPPGFAGQKAPDAVLILSHNILRGSAKTLRFSFTGATTCAESLGSFLQMENVYSYPVGKRETTTKFRQRRMGPAYDRPDASPRCKRAAKCL